MLRTSSAAIALAAATCAVPVLAQGAPAQQPSSAPGDTTTPGLSPPPGAAAASNAPSAEDGVGTDIVVTGSRLGRAGYDAPTPVNVVGDQRVRQLAISNVGDALNQLPSFRAISSPAANSFRVSGNIGARTLDLRGLGPTRTLTLVDGRRFVASSDNGTVDLNSIPSILVQRSEVVTGGASAAYGANAVAGVVNLILDNKLQGLKAEVNAGISQRGDGRSLYAAMAGGRDFAGGRGHIVAAAEYSREFGVGTCEQRSWCSKYTNYIANPGYNTATRTSTNGLPATLVLDNVMFVQNENGILSGAVKSNGAGGTITLGQQVLNTGATSLPAALRGKQFDAGGNLIPYTFGNYLSGLFQQLRDPTQPYLLGFSPTPLVVPTKHYSGIIHGDYEVTDTISLSTEFIYSHVVGGPTATTPVQDSPATIDINNPYLSAATRAAVLAADPGITKLLVNSSSFAIGPVALAKSTLNTYRGAIALKGDLGGGWNWDTYYTYGRVTSHVVDRRSRLKEWNDGVDAVLAPAGLPGIAAGTIICRTTLTQPGNGCIPINLFGFGQVSQAAVDRYLVTETQSRTYQQHAAALNLRGSPFSTWAGEVKIAGGGEWRRDTAEGSADANTLAGNYIQAGTTALPFTRTSVVEGYLEAGVPLLKDSVIGQALDIDGAVRWTHYEPFGNATTWKAGGVYTPVSGLTFRVTRSRDIRAPTAQESSPNATTTTLPLADPFVGATTLQTIVAGGNPNLRLEKGDTFTAGVVLRPGFLPRFNMSVDYYDIKVKGAIDSLSGPIIATACKQTNLLCNLITFNTNGSINTVFSNFQNLSKLHAEGLELVMDYRIPMLGGNVDLQINGNYVIDLSTIGATGVVTQLDDVTGNSGSITNIQGVPRWKLDGLVTYSRERWAITAHGRYIPKGILDSTKIGPEDDGYDVNLPNSININRVSARFYLDLTATIKIPDASGADRYEIFGAINNVFDKDEPSQLRLFGNALHFDPIGRAFRIGIRAKVG
ncbi:TonB-dependent receptor [Sphingomonas sp.]|uniref:TonB-dependent receptor domain-containing protein n=1 Tax=Sphingomonas sp. TaxID=28214 RepID=UPI000DB6ADEB|nr:TonB-dependent receptor [Sphingomonas sp.]PZU08031.1 MAG: TonB-dependent receptor [Sphingomonas sp.]